MTSPTRLSFVVATLLLVVSTAVTATTIQSAARSGNATDVVSFLAQGVNVNAIDADGMTALHWAADRGDPQTVQLLLGAGADVAARDYRGRTPLHYAAVADNAEAIRALLDHGAPVNAADGHGDTPLHQAARRFKADAIGLLLAAGADVNAPNADGQTPLHVLGAAAREPDAAFDELLDSIARVLIAAGADAQRLDNARQPAWPHPAPQGGERQPSGYPAYDDMTNTLLARANQYPSICRRVDLGPSSTNKRIYALEITGNVGVNADKPEFKWIANMHGDEVTGLVMCLDLIDYLLTNYPSNPRVANIVDSIDTWIVPSMNPYGYINNTRYNAAGTDLNRNFPEGAPPSPQPNTTAGRAVEVGTIMNWSFAHSFSLAANLHGGSLVVNYPFDNDGRGSIFSPTPDEDMFVYISEQYSQHNLPMWNSPSFTHGITNGAAWYAITGGMQDWDYRYMGGNEVTIELSDIKSPPYSQMPTFWSQNQESMLSFMETSLIGARGIVTAGDTGAPLVATVTVVGRDHPIYTDPQVGDYHRMLLPGAYQLRFVAAGYDTLTLPVTVATGPATRLDVVLDHPAQVVYPNGGETLPAGTPTNVTWQGSATAQFEVQYSSDYGVINAINDGFETGTLDPAYATGGNLPWVVSTPVAHSGTCAARAGAITHSQSTWMTRTAIAGPLSFWYKVSSQANYDWFNFYIDGTRVIHRAGEYPWTLYSSTLAAGVHTLKWEYVKDASTSGGSDTAWIDDLAFTADLTTWTDIVALTDPGATSVPWTPTVLGSTNKVRVRAFYGNNNIGAWDESAGLFTIAAPQYPLGDLNCDGLVNFADINPFVLALSSSDGYAAAYPNCDIMNGDCNQDGVVNFADINPFVALLVGP